MRLEKTAKGDIILLKVSGSISFSDTSTLKSALHRIAREGKNKIVVDCADMDSLNSRALSIFLSAYRSLNDGVIAFANANPHVTQVFHTSRLDDIFPLHSSVNDAVESVQANT
ncbi:STAS domain-containing protein [bacterium]|nr:STAS domain-containing protein [bacterium]